MSHVFWCVELAGPVTPLWQQSNWEEWFEFLEASLFVCKQFLFSLTESAALTKLREREEGAAIGHKTNMPPEHGIINVQ